MTPAPIGPHAYANGLAAARKTSPLIRAHVGALSPGECRRMAGRGTVFIGVDLGALHSRIVAAAYVTADGYLGGVFSTRPGYGSDVIECATLHYGARRLDCLGDRLADLYAEHGFEETLRSPFDPARASRDWLPVFGEPDYIEMERNL